jgi:creatinine amidohydrolase
MRFGDLNWMDVESYLKTDQRVLLVLGAAEQHGYLSLQTDTRIPLALADAASKETGVLVAPELNFGVSPYFLDFPGTISLRSETMLRVVEDLITSLYRHGFRKIVILNGHSGNSTVKDFLVELANRMDGLKIVFYSWWESHGVAELAQKHNLRPEHASWMEAFYFTRVAELPDGEKQPVRVIGSLNAAETRAAYGDGVFGGKYLADDAVMDEMFKICLSDTLYLLQNL